MADIEKVMAIAEDSRFLSQIEEVLTSDPVWLPQSGPTPLTPYLFLGSNSDAHNVSNLKRLGITHVVNCAGGTVDNSPLYVNEGDDIWVYHAMLAEDHEEYDILQHLPDIQMLIKHARQFGGKVLIHCEMGINSSCALCMAHIMLEYNADLMEVFGKMKELRGTCVVNSGFQRQLIHLARSHNLLYPAPTDDYY